MIVSITGSRNLTITFSDIDKHLPDNATGIVSGGAAGVDSVASGFARARGLSLSVIRPDFLSSEISRLAPLERNTEIIAQADYCLIFWDGSTRGTKDTLAKAVKFGKHGKLIILGSCISDTVLRF